MVEAEGTIGIFCSPLVVADAECLFCALDSDVETASCNRRRVRGSDEGLDADSLRVEMGLRGKARVSLAMLDNAKKSNVVVTQGAVLRPLKAKQTSHHISLHSDWGVTPHQIKTGRQKTRGCQR